MSCKDNIARQCWINFISVTYSRWQHWKCSHTQLEAATVNALHNLITQTSVRLFWYQCFTPEEWRIQKVQSHATVYGMLAPTRTARFIVLANRIIAAHWFFWQHICHYLQQLFNIISTFLQLWYYVQAGQSKPTVEQTSSTKDPDPHKPRRVTPMLLVAENPEEPVSSNSSEIKPQDKKDNSLGVVTSPSRQPRRVMPVLLESANDHEPAMDQTKPSESAANEAADSVSSDKSNASKIDAPKQTDSKVASQKQPRRIQPKTLSKLDEPGQSWISRTSLDIRCLFGDNNNLEIQNHV